MAKTPIITPPLTTRFHGNSGYDAEKEQARKIFTEGETYIITRVEIFSSTTELNLQGIAGPWNSTLFDVAWSDILAFKNKGA
jgi:hypothetical protein